MKVGGVELTRYGEVATDSRNELAANARADGDPDEQRRKARAGGDGCLAQYTLVFRPFCAAAEVNGRLRLAHFARCYMST